MTARPEISVIVPTYNRPKELGRALGALARQKHASFEVIVVDDGGRAPVDMLCAGFAPRLRVALIRQENAGPAAARNRGASEARGAILAFTDDDCAPRDDWIANLAAAVEQSKRPLLVGGRTLNALTGNLFSAASQDVVDFLTLASDGGLPFVASNNIAVRRAAFVELGGFDASFPSAAGEDRAFCRDWARRGWAIVHAPDAVVEHHHRLGPVGYFKQHKAYGRGARRFHGDQLAERFRPFRRVGFYARLVSHPLRQRAGWRGGARACLVAVAQVATVAGYLLEARRLRNEAADGPGPLSLRPGIEP